MATHNGTSGVDTIIVKNKVSTPGYNVTGATPTGDFSDTSLTVNGQAGDDMIDLSGLTTASGVTSVTVNGGNGDDTIRGSDSVDLDVLLAANPTVPISIPRSGTPSPAAWNLTSVGRMDTNGDLVNDYSVWRLENGTADPLTVTLRVYGGGVVWSGTLPPLTNTFVASLSITGTHILDSTLGSRTKAPGPQVFDYDTDIGGDDILNGDSGDDTIYGNGGNDTITGGSGNDTVNGGDGKDTIQVREDDSEFDSIQGGAGTDTVKVLGNWARFDSFNASTSSIETFDASGKIVYGNASDNTLDFSALNAVLNSPAGLTGLQIEGQDGNDIVTGTKFGDLVNAGNGNDTVDGGDANDTLNGQAGDDHLYGGNGNDLLYGNSGIDTVDGGAGDDTIQVREDDSQFDSIHGGDGNDTVKVLGNWVRFNNFNAGTSSIETFDANGKNVYGNATANTLNFSALTSVEDSPLGADKGLRIFAEAGDDTVTGTTFDDVINGEAGNDTLNGGLGNDILNGGADDDTLNGDDGDDLLYGNSGVDSVNGGKGNDIIQVREDDSETDNIQGGDDTDKIEVLGNWARFNNFNASTSSIETFDANGKNVYGNATANTLNFSALTSVEDSPLGADKGLRIFAEAGDDTVTGTTFDDVINGEAGNDTLNGGLGNDTLNGGADNDTLNGDDGDDLLYGNSGTDIVDGGAGNDIIQVREGDSETDTIQGGDDIDKIEVLGNWVRFNNFDAGTSSIETFDANGKNVYGNATANTLNFSALPSVEDSPLGVGKGLRIFAEAGDDTVTGTTFDDVINGEAGNDTLNGGLGNDTLNGGADDDTLNGDDGDDLLYGDSGVDSVNGGKGNDTIQVREGDSEFDTILGGADNDTVKVLGNWARFNNFNAGTSSIEIVDASGKNVHGNGNANVFDFSAAQMVNVPQVNLENGDDTVTTSTNHTVVTTYDGQGGGDKINLLFTPDQLGGFSVGTITAIDNYVSAPTGKTLNAGNTIGFGFTARNFESATANVLVDGQVYNITGYLGGINNVVVATLTQTTINGTPNQDLIVGNALNNTINGLAEADLIFGLGGNDSIKGGAGADYLFGGEGDDTFLANLNEPEDDVLQGGSGIDTLQRTTDGGQGNLVLNGFSATNGIERINLDAGGSNRAIDGNANGNVLDFSATTLLSGNVNGLGGNDTITATNSATRTYDGGDGNDILNGGTQADNLIGGADIDTISGNGGNDNITGGAGADNLDGGEGNDTFYANLTEAELDVLQGGNGVDTLQRTTNGGQGNLVLNDFFADNSIEQINLDAGGSNRAIDGNANGNVLNFSATTLLSGNVFGLGGDDIITATSSAARTYDGGADNDTLIGGTQNDTLIGGSGIDSIFGYDGNDRIVGGDGADTLTGGTGADVFRFANPIEGFDTITDFVVVDDKIEISTSGFTGVGGLGTLSASRFAYAGRETASTRIIYALGTGAVSYDADGSGIGAAVKFAQLNTGLALTNTNFSIGF